MLRFNALSVSSFPSTTNNYLKAIGKLNETGIVHNLQQMLMIRIATRGQYCYIVLNLFESLVEVATQKDDFFLRKINALKLGEHIELWFSVCKIDIKIIW